MCRHTYWNGSPSLRTHRNRGQGSWHQKRKEEGFLIVSQKWVILPLRVEKVLLTWLKPKQNIPQRGYIYLQNSVRLCSYTQLRIKNVHGSAFSVVLELTKKTNCHWCKTNSSSVTSPTNQNLRWKRHWQFISETTLPRPMWSFEEKEIQLPELTYGMTIHSIKWPPDSLVQTGSLQQSSQGVKQHLSHLC